MRVCTRHVFTKDAWHDSNGYDNGENDVDPDNPVMRVFDRQTLSTSDEGVEYLLHDL